MKLTVTPALASLLTDISEGVLQNPEIAIFPAFFTFVPFNIQVESGTIDFEPPDARNIALAIAGDDKFAIFEAPPEFVFRARLDFVIDGLDFDPIATWSLNFVFNSTDDWNLFVRNINGTEILIGTTNSSLGSQNFTISDPLPLSDIIQLSEFSSSSGNILRLIVESVRTGPNVTRDVAPIANVDNVEITVCTNCQAIKAPLPPPPVPPVVNLTTLFLSAGITGGVLLVLISIIILSSRYQKKAARLQEDTHLPEYLSEQLSEISPLQDIVIERKIGQGAYGEVFLGHAFSGTTKVALKKLRKASETAILSEIDILAGIKHPNCVRFYGVHTSDTNDKYLVTEFVENGTVLEWFQEGKGSKASLSDRLKM